MPDPSLVLFYIAGALTLGGALGVVMTRNIVYAAFALLAAMMGVAGVFLLLFADNRQWPIAAMIALAIFGLLVAGIARTDVRIAEGGRQVVEFRALSESLFVQWAVPFEVASLVLLVSLIGAIVMVRSTGGRE